jgi:hypothetical protein
MKRYVLPIFRVSEILKKVINAANKRKSAAKREIKTLTNGDHIIRKYKAC